MFYRKVTDAIINTIKAGVGNWKMPWHTFEVHVTATQKLTCIRRCPFVEPVLQAVDDSEEHE